MTTRYSWRGTKGRQVNRLQSTVQERERLTMSTGSETVIPRH